MKKLNSKWYYLNAGASLEAAIFMALGHNLGMMIFCAAGVYFSWKEAEKRNAAERDDGRVEEQKNAR